jgi:hypothetical protein
VGRRSVTSAARPSPGASEIGEYLVRVDFDVNHIFSDGGAADTGFTADLWVTVER